MKMLCTLAPRSDGTVIYAEGKTRHVFAADEAGDLVCEVDDEAIVAKMLALPHFEPADEADYAKAEALLKPTPGDQPAGDDDSDDDGEFFSETPNGGLPVEGAGDRVAPVEGEGAAKEEGAAAAAPAPGRKARGAAARA